MAPADRPYLAAERGLVLLGALVIGLTFRDYGATWDEAVQSRYGELALDYFRSGFVDRRCNTLGDLHNYGPLFEMLAAALYEWTSAWKAEIRHLLSALAGLLAVAGVMRVARRFGGPGPLPLLAGAALLVWPRFYGHAFVNSKDVPFACAFVWAMDAIASWALAGGGARRTLSMGLVLGLVLALRPGGVVVLAFLGYAALPLLRLRERRLAVIGQLALAATIAWTLMVAFWPWAHEGPIQHPLEAMNVSYNFPHPFPNLFDGRWIGANELPWNYVPQWLLITTPEVFTVLAAIGALAAARGALRPAEPPASKLVSQLVLLWVLAPVVFVLVRRPPLYDEVRHLLFILPGAALLAGLGLERAIRFAEPRLGRVAWLFPILLLSPLPDLVALHPYEITYFNAWTRAGAGTLSERYDTDFWLSSYKEAMEWVNRQPVAPGEKRHVLVAASPAFRAAADYAAPHVVATPGSAFTRDRRLPPDFDTYIATTRFFLHGLYPDEPVVHVIGREGMVFAVVKSRISP